MRGLGGGYGDPQSLRQVVGAPLEVRASHRDFVQIASDGLLSSLAESTNLLRDVGVGKLTPPVGGASSLRDELLVRQGAKAPTRSIGGVAPPSSSDQLAVRAPSAKSARDLFAALKSSDGKGGVAVISPSNATSPRVARSVSPRPISVRDFQRGTPVVAPAPPLPSSDGLSLGQRRRQGAFARAESYGSHHGTRWSLSPERSKDRSQLADGVTSMLPGVRVDLGELALTPAEPLLSSTLALIDKLVETPEACFARPLAIMPQTNAQRRMGVTSTRSLART
eukprot:TRINITY_DN57299_c0_g1_i1.p1 TRINITY_DN57299_c0_g1~~TRINITY_DN57299_c0_g1_i1.p1  ORF type:complete len:280 (-),score=38.80 TRINITY_DN57299_c0_g1_i1:180-1019(-)